MNIEKKFGVLKKLVNLMIEHKQDLNSPDAKQLLAAAFAFIERHENAGIKVEIKGARSGDGFFEFKLSLPSKIRPLV